MKYLPCIGQTKWRMRTDIVRQLQVSPAYNSCPIKYQISENEITFLDATVFKGERFTVKSILDIKTHYKPTETFQYTHFTSCHPPRVKRGFIKGEAIRLLRTNSSTTFHECLANFKQRFEARRYPKQDTEKLLQNTLTKTIGAKTKVKK